ncbi:MAG: hypothetical protein H7039_02140 [Bryobacteraceae bacterium]|nr:hypothetical protein [Bryobacteraceae bacterium]
MTRLYFTLGVILLAALSFALVVAEPLSPHKAHRYAIFDVRASESGGSIVLDWDPKSVLVDAATNGLLESNDGGVSHSDTVEARVLRQGGLEYRRRSEDVTIRLRLMKGSETIGESSVKLTGLPAIPGAPKP